ncbi:hypothetical protein [Salidesulfovibrio onnuriiensis]|uniref:hypothetical protein n=1 Tax=Salidesulfovibrio onnuriiensis TaxID=2583823 RepID=UPI0011C79C67|nr:hypothetical protein [Salidesulfovibrio onnuriiensis]
MDNELADNGDTLIEDKVEKVDGGAGSDIAWVSSKEAVNFELDRMNRNTMIEVKVVDFYVPNMHELIRNIA